jgi:hypothetical protein
MLKKYDGFVRADLQQQTGKRQFGMAQAAQAIMCADRVLPRACRRDLPLFATGALAGRIAETCEAHGAAAVSSITQAVDGARRTVLLQSVAAARIPAEVYDFARRFFGMHRHSPSKPPIIERDPRTGEPTGTLIIGSQQRVEHFKTEYARSHSSAASSNHARQLLELVEELERTHPDLAASCPEVATAELRVVRDEMSTNTCADPHGMCVEHLKHLGPESLDELRVRVDRCLRLGKIPDAWHVSRGSPVPKANRPKEETASWRPVSVTSLMSRLVEGVWSRRMQHLFEHGVDADGRPNRHGQSQFGFRRGYATSAALSAATMFMQDGLLQGHASLMLFGDCVQAFNKAPTVVALRRLAAMPGGGAYLARWAGRLLQDRQLWVHEDGAKSGCASLDRGVPQGSIVGPHLWSLVIDDLIARIEDFCREQRLNCVAIPIVFADDINVIVRGPDMDQLVRVGNELMRILHEWSEEVQIPIAKLGALWVTGSDRRMGVYRRRAEQWKAADGEIVCGNCRCVPSITPQRLLGVIYDHTLRFEQHVQTLEGKCAGDVRLIASMSELVKTEHLAVMEQALIQSRLLFAVDAYYPCLTKKWRDRVRAIHARACRLVTGMWHSCHSQSVEFECGFRDFDELAHAEMTKIADCLRRADAADGAHGDRGTSVHCFGMQLVARLFKGYAMPTASPLPGVAAAWPTTPAHLRLQERCNGGHCLRGIGAALHIGAPDVDADTRAGHPALRGLPVPHPRPPHELRICDKLLRFITSPPGGLTRLPGSAADWPKEQQAVFRAANAARMCELAAIGGPDALYLFTDGSRDESELRCAGAFVLCRGPVPTPDSIIHIGHVRAGPIACIYTAEVATMEAGYRYVLEHCDELFAGLPPARRALVGVADCQSGMAALQVTFVRRQERCEQIISGHLVDLCARGVRTTLGFVFSHLGVAGNDCADVEASRAMHTIGRLWPLGGAADMGIWHVDSTRHCTNERRRAGDVWSGFADSTTPPRLVSLQASLHGKQAFRFSYKPRHHPLGRRMCNAGERDDRPTVDRPGAPSLVLPSDMSRADEKLLLAARLGIIDAAGGHFVQAATPCPLCGAPDAMGRSGLTVKHFLLGGCASFANSIDIADLWRRPHAAVAVLMDIVRRCEALRVDTLSASSSSNVDDDDDDDDGDGDAMSTSEQLTLSSGDQLNSSRGLSTGTWSARPRQSERTTTTADDADVAAPLRNRRVRRVTFCTPLCAPDDDRSSEESTDHHLSAATSSRSAHSNCMRLNDQD